MYFNCIEIAGRLNLEPGRAKEKFFCFCGHDEKTPSLSINENGFFCFGCGIHGNATELVIAYHEVALGKTINKVEATNWISQKRIRKALDKKLKRPQKFLETTEVLILKKAAFKDSFSKELINLGVSPDHLSRWNVITCQDNNTALIHQNIYGQYTSVKIFQFNSNLNKVKCWTPKGFRQEDGYYYCLFGEHFLVDADEEHPIMLVESEKTAIIGSWCIPEYVWLAGGGANGFTNSKIKVLEGFNNINICFDCDEPGRMAARRLKSKFGQGVKIIDIIPDRRDGYDVADYFISNMRRINQQTTHLSDSDIELIQERAAILQFDFYMSRTEAELEAIRRLEISHQ